MNIVPTTTNNHNFVYTYKVDRGTVVVNNDKTISYYAPFTGGSNKIEISVFDKDDNINLPTITKNILVEGESVSYVSLPGSITEIGEQDNRVIVIASENNNLTYKREIGQGRTPTISPDGQYIAYTVYKNNGTSQIIIKDPVGNQTNITNDDNSLNLNPSWSPVQGDENEQNLSIIFSSNRGNANKKFHLWKINLKTKELVQVTKEDGNDIEPDWSPDGKKNVFVSDLDNNIQKDYNNLYTLELDTGKRSQLTYQRVSNQGMHNPSWSANSTKIVYTRKYQKKQIEYLANFQKIWLFDTTIDKEFGVIMTREWDDNIIESYPSFSADSRLIKFVRKREKEIALVSIDSRRPTGGIGFYFPDPENQYYISNLTEAKQSRQKISIYNKQDDLFKPYDLENN